MARERISVTELAAYADNPEKFCQSKGKAYNQAAAEYGDKQHYKLGKRGAIEWIFPVLIMVLAVICFGLYWGWELPF
ncbi:hypothetical protein TUM3792_20970 [Shewanella sp. MBTL60-007]|nr:hypothetical protein TUM3792_20970 [Shewanella sp. MBTL60-007]